MVLLISVGLNVVSPPDGSTMSATGLKTVTWDFDAKYPPSSWSVCNCSADPSQIAIQVVNVNNSSNVVVVTPIGNSP